jgi:integration host factor subunit alpha
MTSKKSLSKNISNNLGIPLDVSKAFTNSFLSLIKKNYKTHIIKFSNFGTFRKHKTPTRIGRNPKTKETYMINSSYKMLFKPSNNIKNKLN